MKIAVCSLETNVVENIIIAELDDPPPPNTYFVNAENKLCDIGWIWDGTDFIPPPESGVTDGN